MTTKPTAFFLQLIGVALWLVALGAGWMWFIGGCLLFFWGAYGARKRILEDRGQRARLRDVLRS